VKRAAITGVTRDKEYNITKGKPDSRILYFSANPNGESEVIRISLKPKPKLRNLVFEYDFGDLAIKGRNSIGNILTKHSVMKITQKEKGVSTLGGRKIWFDEGVNRLNADDRGKFLGEFGGEDKILVLTKSGTFRLSNFDLSNHYEDDILIIERFVPDIVFSAAYYDAGLKFYYVKRFTIEPLEKTQSFINGHPESCLECFTRVKYPRFEIKFGGRHKKRTNEIIEVAEFIGIKSYKAKGKRLTKYEVESITELEPLVEEQPELQPDENGEEKNIPVLEPGNEKGQMSLDF